MSAYHVPGIVIGTLFGLIHLILTIALFSWLYYHSHFKGQKTEKPGSADLSMKAQLI